MDLTASHYAELIGLALNKRAGWVPLGPLNAARRGRKLLTYHWANELADLERAGLVLIEPGKNPTPTGTRGAGDTGTIRLTQAGRAAIISIPDDLHVELYPLPADIAKAKPKITAISQKMHDPDPNCPIILDAEDEAALDQIWAEIAAEDGLDYYSGKPLAEQN